MAAGQALSGFATPLYNKIYIAVRITNEKGYREFHFCQVYNIVRIFFFLIVYSLIPFPSDVGLERWWRLFGGLRFPGRNSCLCCLHPILPQVSFDQL